MATGWQKLGEMLAGGGAPGAYQDQMMGNYKMGQARSQDILGQMKVGALGDDLIPALEAAGLAPAFAAFARAGINPEQYTGAGIDLGTQRAQTGAFDAAGRADLNEMNRYLALQQGKPVDLSVVQGNTLLNPMVAPGSQDGLTSTPLGESMITENQAQADAASARAGLSRAKQSNPAAFYDTGGVSPNGTLGMPTITGPRGIPVVATGDKTFDRQRLQQVDAGLEALDTIESLRQVGQDERNYGVTGKLRNITQNLIQQGDAMAQQFGGEAARIRDELVASGSEVDMGNFDPNLPLIELMANTLAYKRARALSGPGLLSNQDFANARVGLNPTAMLANKAQFMAVLDSIENTTAEQIKRYTPQGQQGLGMPGALGDLLLPTQAPGAVATDSAEQMIQQIEADAGAPLSEQQKAELRRQMTNGQGEFNVGVPQAAAPAAMEYDYVPGRGLVPRN